MFAPYRHKCARLNNENAHKISENEFSQQKSVLFGIASEGSNNSENTKKIDSGSPEASNGILNVAMDKIQESNSIKTHPNQPQDLFSKFFASKNTFSSATKLKELVFEGIGPLNLDLSKINIKYEQQNEEYKKNFIYDLEIVDNQNRREKIKVSHHPGKVHEITSAPNAIDTVARDNWYKELEFTTDYSQHTATGYKPISMQKKQEENFNYKSHFIRKKQSSQNASIKRCCGVSYVKESESQQLHVEHIFQKLPHIMIQASTSCEVLEEYEDFVSGLFENLFCNENSDYSLLLAWFETDDEALMREYLLYPKKRFQIANNQLIIESLCL